MKASELKIGYAENYKKNSSKILKSNPRIEKAFLQKIEFIKDKGLNYPSITAKKLEPKNQNTWEFYITKQYRCLFLYDEEKQDITILKICNHL